MRAGASPPPRLPPLRTWRAELEIHRALRGVSPGTRRARVYRDTSACGPVVELVERGRYLFFLVPDRFRHRDTLPEPTDDPVFIHDGCNPSREWHDGDPWMIAFEELLRGA